MEAKSESVVGDVVLIPHDDGTESYAVVLFVCERDNVILLGLFNRGFSNPSQVDSNFDSLLYTYDILIREGAWKVVDRVYLQNVERYSRRNVGGVIWEGTERIKVDKHEIKAIPVMQIAGTGAASKYIRFLLRGGEEKAFYRVNTRTMSAFLSSLSEKA